jgi:hypothetical protein
MTKINGLTFLQEISFLNKNTFFILVSSIYDERIKQDAIVNGAYNYYRKNSYYTIKKEINKIIDLDFNKSRK